MTYNASESFNQALEIFSSLYEDMAPSDVPAGLSPDCQDVQFLPGGVFTRAALNKFLSAPTDPNDDIVSVADFPLANGDYYTVWLASSGLWFQRDLQTGAVSGLPVAASAGSQFKYANVFNNQFYATHNAELADAFSDSPFVGTDTPKYYDGKNVWRVTYDAPGGTPVFANIPTLPVNLVQSAPAGSVTITGVNSSGGHSVTIQTGQRPIVLFYYATLTYQCSAPVNPAWVGLPVTLAGITGTNASLANVTGTIISVVGSAFTINVGTGETNVSLTGLSGTGTVQGNYFQRSANIVTAYLGTSIPNNFQVGLYAQIVNSNASAINGPNWTINSSGGISRDATGLVTVVINTQLTNLAEGTQLFINASDTTDFPPSLQTVFQVISSSGGSTVFTISNPTWGNGAVVSSSAGGSVYQVWSGTFQIQSLALDSNGNAFFTYFQLGPDITLASTGGTPTAQLQSQLAPGPRNAVLIFEGANGQQTGASVPIQLAAVGGTTLLSAQNIPLGPLGTQKRIIAFTPAFGSSYYYLAPSIIPSIDGLPPVVGLGTIINDNTTTSAIIDFSDTQLTSSDSGVTQIDIQGNNLFNQIVLAPCLGVIGYEGRVGWWGEINDVKNFVNLHFDGGYDSSSAGAFAGSASSSGIGAWNNPSNILSPSTYADVTVNSPGTSAPLVTETFGFSFPTGGTVNSITVGVLGYATNGHHGLVTAQLVVGGVATGAKVTVQYAGGTSASPATFNFSIPIPSGLTVAQVNAGNFGVQFTASVPLASTSVDFFLTQPQMNVVVANNFPLGWSTAGSSGGTVTLNSSGTMGGYISMSGAGGLNDCMISQSCYEDYYGDAILAANTQYYFRFLAGAQGSLTGNFICDIFSASQGTLATVSIPVSSLGAAGGFLKFVWQTELFSATLPTPMPSDAVIRIYLQGSNATVSIDEPEFIPQNQPVNFQQMRVSYFDNEFGYDEDTGIVEISGSAKLTGAFAQRGYLYMLTDGPMFQTQNNGQTEPSGWAVSNFADECDCFGPNAVAFTEDLAWWAGPLSGVRVFNGAKPSKISQEIQPTWDLINDAAPLSVWLANDSDQRALYVGAPVPGTPYDFLVIPMSYRNVGDVANDPAPLRQSLSGKMIPLELCRKWTIWNMPMFCAQMVTQNTSVGQKKQMLFGGESHGNLYWLNPAKFTDDDYGTIASYYTTCFFFNHETEQGAPGLGLHRKLFTFLSLYVSGVGRVQITPLVDNLANPWTLTPTVWNALTNRWTAGGPGTFQGACNASGTELILVSPGNLPLGVTQVIIGSTYYNVTAQGIGTLTLSVSPGTLTNQPFMALYTPAALPPMPLYALSASPSHDLEWPMNVRGERMALKIAVIPLTGQTDAAFNLQHLVIAGRMDRMFPVRGALLP